MALVMGKWGCWLAVAVHIVVRGKEAMDSCSLMGTEPYRAGHFLPWSSHCDRIIPAAS